MSEADRLLAGVPRETLDDLRSFVAELEETSAHTNLVSRATLAQAWERHVLDSAQLVRLLPDAKRWLDLGSGGGFPGLVTAILLKDEPGAHVDLVESTGKKAAFLSGVARRLGLPAQVWNARIESLSARVKTPDAVSARALAPLPRLLDWAGPWLVKGAVGLFHKGRNFAQEVEASRTAWRFDVVDHASLTDADAAILEIRNLRRA